MRIVLFFFLYVCAFLLYSCGTSAAGKKTEAGVSKPHPVDVVLKEPVTLVNYTILDSLTPLLEQAKLANRPVFVDFYTTWCMPCRLMDETVFNNEELADYLNKNMLNMKINAEKGNGVNLSVVFNIAAYPTLIFLDFNGNELVRKEGSCSTSDFRRMAEEAVNKMKNK